MRLFLIGALSVAVVGCIPVGITGLLAEVGGVLYTLQILVEAVSSALGG